MRLRLAILLFTLLVASNLWFVAGPVDWRMPLAILGGWFLADLASGVVHMVMDYRPCVAGRGLDRLFFYADGRDGEAYQALFRKTMAGINPFERLVFDFKNHHPRPHALGRRTMLRQIGSTIVAAGIPFAALLTLACVAFGLPNWLVAGALAFLTGGIFSQYFHGTLHREDNPWIVRAMRRTRLLMTPAMHERHHASLQRDFATISGWSNPLLNVYFRRARAKGRFDSAGLEPG